MPALHLFGRTWRVGSDDFVFPGLIDLLISVIWLIASVIVYWKNDSYMDCSGNQDMRIYVYGVFAILHLIIITSAALVYYSKAGSIMDVEARRHVPLCLYVRILLQAFVISWNTLGSVWAFDGTLSCPMAPEIVTLVVGFIICNWIIVCCEVVGIFIIFDPFGTSQKTLQANENCFPVAGSDSIEFAQLRENRHGKIWSGRLRRYCLSPFTTSSSTKWALNQAGLLLGSSFINIDIVPTDFAAGLILLSLRSRCANKEESALQETLPVSEKTPIVSQPSTQIPLSDLLQQDWRHPRLLPKYHVFAMASYNWPLVCFDSKPNAVGKLCQKSFICGCIPGRKHPLNVEGDSCCFFRTAGVRHVAGFAGIADEDFIHLDFVNKVYGNPFFVVKDEETKTIVISIRGTMSMDDVLTDLSGWPTQIGSEYPPTFKAHNGMLTSAIRVKEKLEALKILPQVLDEHQGYGLVTTGTSLGAGVSAILSILLRKQYPQVKCYAFAPPGGLLTLELAEYTNDFVQSCIYGNDIIPRLGIRTIEKLKYSVLDILKQTKTPKYRILLGGITLLAGIKPKASYCDQVISPDRETETSNRRKSKAQLIVADSEKEEISQQTKNNNCDSMTVLNIQDEEQSLNEDDKLWLPCGDMWPPGRIIYITETVHFRSGHSIKGYKGSSRWRMRWADRKEFKEVIIHERMVWDHLPYRMQKALQVIVDTQLQVGPQPTLN
ncbi:unnamed protein product [Allacma fusca]|uniref:Fungal lipase-type domain-containing protein n=1 Tax=Allacma fusca TaxID=39272 RepID=A0A8J2J8X8_9HEXA|nr:unnamed protein product [Allacma fusca]